MARRPRNRRAVLIIILILGLTSRFGRAEVLYSVLGRGSATNAGALAVIDSSTGKGTLVGSIVARGGVSGVDFDASGRLWASSVAGSPRASELLLVNPDSGATIFSVPITADRLPISIGDLAIQPGTDVLYGVRSGADRQGLGGSIYEINKTTGAAKLIGRAGTSGGGLAFSPDGRLFKTSRNLLLTVDPATGSILLQTQLTGPDSFPDGLAVRPSDSTLFATGNGDDILIIDTVTGQGVKVGDSGLGHSSDLAFRTRVVPEPVSIGLWVAIALLVAGAHWYGWQKRQIKVT